MPRSHTCPSILAVLLSSIFIQLTHCAPTIPSLPSHPIYSLPPLHPVTPLDGTSNGNCASTAEYPSWSSDDWVIEDCYSAVQQLYLREVFTHPDVSYEFVAAGMSPPKFHPTAQRTPRKYVVKSCVLTIMMLDWFHPGQLPQAQGYNRAKTDVSTYRDIWSAARSIETACTVSKSPGWLMTGRDSAMGVFVWATDSHINEATGGFPVQSIILNDDSNVMILDDVRTA